MRAWQGPCNALVGLHGDGVVKGVRPGSCCAPPDLLQPVVLQVLFARPWQWYHTHIGDHGPPEVVMGCGIHIHVHDMQSLATAHHHLQVSGGILQLSPSMITQFVTSFLSRPASMWLPSTT